MDMHELKSILENQNGAFEDFQARHMKFMADQDTRVANLEKALDAMDLKVTRAATFGGGSGGPTYLSPDERSAFGKAYNNAILGDQAKLDKYLAEAKGMTAGTLPDGGYVTNTELSSVMTMKAQELSPVSSLARTVFLRQGADAFEEVADIGDMAARWVHETWGPNEDDTPNLGKMTVPLNELQAMPKVSQKLIDVANIDVVSWLNEKIAVAFALAESAAFINGDGVIKPRGILSYPTSSAGDTTRPWGTIQYVPSGGASGFAASNPSDALIDLQHSLKPAYLANAVWLMPRSVINVVRKFKDGQGIYLWAPSITQGQPSTLLGHPVYACEDLPAITGGAFPVIFGDLRTAYTVIRKEGIKLLTDPYTDKPNVRLYTYGRVGGGMFNFEAVKLLKIGTS